MHSSGNPPPNTHETLPTSPQRLLRLRKSPNPPSLLHQKSKLNEGPPARDVTTASYCAIECPRDACQQEHSWRSHHTFRATPANLSTGRTTRWKLSVSEHIVTGNDITPSNPTSLFPSPTGALSQQLDVIFGPLSPVTGGRTPHPSRQTSPAALLPCSP